MLFRSGARAAAAAAAASWAAAAEEHCRIVRSIITVEIINLQMKAMGVL